jgi:uncharacterized protein
MQSVPPLGITPSRPWIRSKLNVIKVSGEGLVSVQPDRAVVTLGVITENKNLSTSQKENAETTTKVMGALLNLGIPKENIKTVEYRVEPQYDYENGKQILRGYKTTHLLQVTLDHLTQAGPAIDAAVSQGANSVSNIEFTLAHPEYYYQQALALALINGHQKALTISRTLGVTLNPIPQFVMETTQQPSPLPRPTVYFARSEGTPIEPGKLQINAAVRVEYSYFTP